MMVRVFGILICALALVLQVNARHGDATWGSDSDENDDVCPSLSCNFAILERLIKLEHDQKCFRSCAFNVRTNGGYTLAKEEKVPYSIAVFQANTKFDVTNRQFVAEYPGVYMFSFTACDNVNYINVLDLKQDGVVIAQMRLGDEDFKDCNSETAVAHLDKGDKVWVERSVDDTNSDMFDGEYWNSFVGALISPDCGKLDDESDEA